MKQEIKYISIEQVYKHPQNPRKDVGDVTELADSIKNQGILQNLTVVKGHYIGDDFIEDDGYTLIIGHRRWTAAKLAGLIEVPCIVVEMDKQDQFRTMMVENMQRSDLTAYEQAEGFQMMLDFGDNVADISQKTGFSITTVKNRVKLLNIDKNQFAKGEKLGATLFDFIEVGNLKNQELRDKVTKHLGTKDFQNELLKAKKKDKDLMFFEDAKNILSEWAEEIDKNETYVLDLNFITSYSATSKKEISKPDGEGPFYFAQDIWQGAIGVYSKKTPDEIKSIQDTLKKSALKIELQSKVWQECEEMANRHRELRYKFILNISEKTTSEHLGDIEQCLSSVILGRNSNNQGYIYGHLNFHVNTKLLKENVVGNSKKLLVLACSMLDRTKHSYAEKNLGSGEAWVMHYENKNTTDFYNLINKLGYEMSTEEIEMQNGEHQIFATVDILT